MSEYRPGRSSRWPVVVLVLVALLLVAVVMARLGLGVAADHDLDRAEASWREAGHDLDALEASLARRTGNASAGELEALVQPLALDLVPFVDRSTKRQRRPPGHPLNLAASAAGGWLGNLAASESAAVSEPPAALLAWTAANAAAFDAVRAHLREAPAPEWPAAYRPGSGPATPNLLDILHLQRLLLGDALARDRAGDAAGAVASFEASWNLQASLGARPELISQLVAATVSTWQAAVARRLSSLPADPWAARLVERDPRAAMRDALVAEALVLRGLSESPDNPLREGGEQKGLDRLVAPLAAPLVEAWAAELLQAEATWIESLESAGPCPPDAAAMRAATAGTISPGNRIANVFGWDYANPATRAWLAAMQLELSSKVLVLRAAGGQPPEDWSQASCPANAWRADATEGDGVRVALDGPVPRDPSRSPAALDFTLPGQ